MKKLGFISAFIVLFSFAISVTAASNVRPPAVAGGFYPSNMMDLNSSLEAQFQPLRGYTPIPQSKERLVSVIVPHAGYIYSGAVAAYAYREISLKGHFDTYIILANSHYSSFSGAAIYNKGGFRTPMGTVPINEELAAELEKIPGVSAEPKYHIREHAIEVQLPFLQKIDNKFNFVPILFGQADYFTVEKTAKVLAAYMKKHPKTLVIASTDLSHFKDYNSAMMADKITVGSILSDTILEYYKKFQTGRAELCGPSAVLASMIINREMNAKENYFLKYANSGDSAAGAKNKDRVVGYCAIVNYVGGKKMTTLNADEKKVLLSIARKSLEASTSGQSYTPETPPSPTGVLLENRGAFVTLNKDDKLRGCIGVFTPDQPLYKVVTKMARSAALEDPRFPSVTPKEISDIKIEISVLSPLEKTNDPSSIEVGKHGIYIIQGSRRGVLLPQVATEYGWDRETFLEQTCRKAGLPKDAWRSGSEIYLFTADVFGEDHK